MHDPLPLLRAIAFPPLKRGALTTLQVNLGYLCNQSCQHCHVNAGPTRKELMDGETVDLILRFLDTHKIPLLDITGGAPELNPHFRALVRGARTRGVNVIDRCNLTVLFEPGQEDTAEFLAQNQVTVVASMPCYLEENVDAQRGKGVFDSSIAGLQRLNELGYASDPTLNLDLVYNPQGPSLPPAQCELEADYKKQLRERFDVRFNRLLTLANMPIARFGSTLISHGEFDRYMDTLQASHQDSNLQTVMCRELLSVDWQGYVFDCDFNQMLDLPIGGHRTHLKDLMAQDLTDRSIVVAGHCYGCTAGQGSSCGGALV